MFFTRLSHYPARFCSDGPLTVRRAHDYGVCVFLTRIVFVRVLVVAWLLRGCCLIFAWCFSGHLEGQLEEGFPGPQRILGLHGESDYLI